jgi:ADP-ribose pyrophosphatase YjhB (NUDIX family)
VSTEEAAVWVIARAVIPIGRELLMLEETRDDGAVLIVPGWARPVGETGADTLLRALRMEAGIRVRVPRLLYVSEVFSAGHGCPVHELGLYYLVELEDDADLAADAPLADALRVVDLQTAPAPVEPSFLRSLLVEDLENGFVRPVAHVVDWQAVEGASAVQVTW